MVDWGEGVLSPGVCAGARRWLLSVVPDAVPISPDGKVQIAPIVSLGESRLAATVLHVDPAYRLCLIEAETPIPGAKPFKIAERNDLRAGASLYCLASGEKCRTALAGKDRVYLGLPLYQPLLRVRVEDLKNACHPGTPLVNEAGELAGILTARKLQAEGEAHAIPSLQLRKLITDFRLHRRSGNVWVGLVLHDHTTTPEILEVRPDSPAERAGLKTNDVILEIGGTEVDHIEALVEAIHGLPAGQETSIKVLRKLEPIDLVIVPEFAAGAPSP